MLSQWPGFIWQRSRVGSTLHWKSFFLGQSWLKSQMFSEPWSFSESWGMIDMGNKDGFSFLLVFDLVFSSFLFECVLSFSKLYIQWCPAFFGKLACCHCFLDVSTLFSFWIGCLTRVLRNYNIVTSPILWFPPLPWNEMKSNALT